ncbi:MAG: hypothetical protein ABTQ73_08480 [Caldilineales bacterium]
MTLPRLSLTLSLILVLMLTACGSQNAPATQAPTQPAAAPAAADPTATPQPAAPAEPAATACEDYFGFCITAQASGAVEATGAGGWASSSNTDCTALAAAGAARILELPNLLPAGENKITVALTRIGAYTGPGTYTLAASATGGAMPDMFPAVRIADRAFNNGDSSAATITINADGSGSLTATGLVEMDAMQGVTPDPTARLDFAMQWTCQGNK